MTASAHTAPCGHPGVPVIGTFVLCSVKGCDGKPSSGVPRHVDAEKTAPICRQCGYDELKPYGVGPATGTQYYWCDRCRTVI